MAAIKRRRTALTVRQLVEDYLTHQLTRPVTQVSTRHHLNQLLALYGGWQARRVGAALRRSPLWTQVTARLYGENKARSALSMTRSRERAGTLQSLGRPSGYGGHFRAVQGFRYIGGTTCAS